MNDIELRERFAQWADPLRAAPPPPVATIRRRARRHAVSLAVTSGLVLGAVGLTAGLVASGLGATGRPPDARPWGSARYPAPPGEPYVLVNDSAHGRAELRDAATGAVVDVLRPSGHGASFIAATAAADDRLFVLGEQNESGQVTFAELRITVSGGKPSVRLARVLRRVHLPLGCQLISMSVNATGTRLALTALPLGSAVSPTSLNVYDLSSGVLMESWRPPGLSISNQQFIGGADELAVFWPTSGPVASVSGDRVEVHQPVELRLVDTAAAFAPGSSLLADSRADHAVSVTAGGSFSQDGSVVLNADAGELESTTPQGPTADLLESDAVSDRLLWTVPLGPASAQQNPAEFCGVLWASANGRDLLTQCGTRQLSIINGRARVIHLAWIFPAADGNLLTGESTDGQQIYREFLIASFAW